MLNLPGCPPLPGGDGDRMDVYRISAGTQPVPLASAHTSSGILTASALCRVSSSCFQLQSGSLPPTSQGSPGDQAFWRELPKGMASRSQPSCCAVSLENQGHKDGLKERDKRFWDNCCLDKWFWQLWEGTEECTAPAAIIKVHQTANTEEPEAQQWWMGYLVPALPPTNPRSPKP